MNLNQLVWLDLLVTYNIKNEGIKSRTWIDNKKAMEDLMGLRLTK